MKTEQLIRQCLARGYSHTVNELDIKLIDAMTEEIMQMFDKQLPATVTLKYDNFRKAHETITDLLDNLLK